MKSKFFVVDENEKTKPENSTSQPKAQVEQTIQNVSEDEYLKVLKDMSKDITAMKDNLSIITGVVIFNIITMIIAVIFIVFMVVLN